MAKISKDLEARFHEYVRETYKSKENLSFLLTNLGFGVSIDGSQQSLEQAEKVFWSELEQLPDDLTDADHFASLLGQYLSLCCIESFGARLIQCVDSNSKFGQPCIDGFGNEKWERIYPVALAIHLQQMPVSQPHFPGVRNNCVFATAFEKASKVHSRKN